MILNPPRCSGGRPSRFATRLDCGTAPASGTDLRAPYRRVLTGLAGRRGVPMIVGGQTMRLSADVVNLNWETVEVESYRAFAA